MEQVEGVHETMEVVVAACQTIVVVVVVACQTMEEVVVVVPLLLQTCWEG